MELEPTTLDQERLRLIEEIGRALGGVSNLDDVLRRAARAMVPGLADLAVVLTDGQGATEGLEVAHVDVARESAIGHAVTDAFPALRELAASELRKGRTFRWIPTITSCSDVSAGRSDPRLARLLEEAHAASLIVVALGSGGVTIGALGLARTASREAYGAADLAVAQVLARRVGVAVETARLRGTMHEAERRNGRVRDALGKWTRVFDLAGWGAAVVDGADRRMEAVNPAFARMHGYGKPDELTGRLFSDILPADFAEEVQAWGPAPEGPGTSYESVHVRSDGTRFPVLVNVTPMVSEGVEGSYVVTVQELSELKRAEERLRRAQRMEAVGRLAGGVAHEVNNMMTIILGFSDLLGRAPDLPDPLQRDVEEIRKAATRAGRITQQLLAFSRQQVLQPADLPINSVVEELVPVLRLLLPANIRVETRLAPLDAVVRADRAQLEQVLINLAFNARDAMAAGGTIRLATDSRQLDEEAGRRLIGIPFPPGQYGVISVIDTGHGMDSETVAQVFEPFFTTKPVGLGTGLGLATVYGIVKQSGGYVWVESTPGEGTTFSVGLPAVMPEAVATPPEVQIEPAEPDRGGTVLVVEDEDGVRELAGRILKARGYCVLEARNGAEAVSALDGDTFQVDMVLTDVVVPDLGTDELQRRLRELRPDLPILYMSGYPREDVIERKLIRSDHPFLQKPFTTRELVECVGRVLRERDEVVGR
ncbi:MAG: response regulator [Gemmatimonadales bacterium]|nr:response regulator [Gemmatimonadales bacterium]